MLTDLGLQTEEQIKSYNDACSRRAADIFNKTYHGCVSTVLCKNCNHLFSDSICCCAGLGVCPNCSFDNSTGNPKMIGDGVLNPPTWKFYTKNDFLKIVDKVFSAGDLNEAIAKELKQEIEKL